MDVRLAGRDGGGLRSMFAGKLVLVTGAGRGIGRAAAVGFAAEGAAVIATDIDPAKAGETAAAITEQGGRSCRLIRYADDFVITGATQQTLEQVKEEVAAFLAERGLSLAPEKTRIVQLSNGFDFLGFNVRTYHGKLLIKPSKDAQGRIHRRVREVIGGSKAITQYNLIHWLNPLIQGWANYYRHVVSAETFHTLDSVLWQALWRWAVRRHPKKSRRWVAERYFHKFGARHWVFACTKSHHPHGEQEWVKLAAASDIKIRRHVKVKADANPYDSEWTQYFLGRRSVMAGPHRSLRGLSRI